MKMTDLPVAPVRLLTISNSSFGLLRRQHGGRLVEDQDLRAAVERLQDLDPLLLTDRDRRDRVRRVDGEPELLRQLAHALLGGA